MVVNEPFGCDKGSFSKFCKRCQSSSDNYSYIAVSRTGPELSSECDHQNVVQCLIVGIKTILE